MRRNLEGFHGILCEKDRISEQKIWTGLSDIQETRTQAQRVVVGGAELGVWWRDCVCRVLVRLRS